MDQIMGFDITEKYTIDECNNRFANSIDKNKVCQNPLIILINRLNTYDYYVMKTLEKLKPKPQPKPQPKKTHEQILEDFNYQQVNVGLMPQNERHFEHYEQVRGFISKGFLGDKTTKVAKFEKIIKKLENACSIYVKNMESESKANPNIVNTVQPTPREEEPVYSLGQADPAEDTNENTPLTTIEEKGEEEGEGEEVEEDKKGGRKSRRHRRRHAKKKYTNRRRHRPY